MEWDGEFKSTMDAQLSLIPGMAPALAVILIIIVALFNSMRPPFIMFLTIPFAAIGIIWVLAGTNTAFGFMALLGAMSLVGMMIKNAIVLLDEINLNIDGGMGPYEATVMAAVSRLRPVVLAALTTVLGVLPLLQDAFLDLDGNDHHGGPDPRYRPDDGGNSAVLCDLLPGTLFRRKTTPDNRDPE